MTPECEASFVWYADFIFFTLETIGNGLVLGTIVGWVISCGTLAETEDNSLPKPITDAEIESAYQIVWKRLNPGERS